MTGSSSEESIPKRRKILSDYKQRTPRKSPLKTPTKRKTPRLRCENVLCRVGFSTKKAKLQHERFSCPFLKSPLEALSSSTTTSAGGDDKQCRFCDKVFTEVKSRKRHERDQHQASGSSRKNASNSFSSLPAMNVEVDMNWNTPRCSDKMDNSESKCKFCHQGIKSSYRLSLHTVTISMFQGWYSIMLQLMTRSTDYWLSPTTVHHRWYSIYSDTSEIHQGEGGSQ